MRITAVVMILFLLPVGCATLAERSRREKFDLISKSFERALRTSDYTEAAKYLDTPVAETGPDLKHLRNYKISDYKIVRIHVSEDKQQITQDAELQYFRLNGTILHSTRYPQTWRYIPDREIWLLATGLPDLGPQPPRPRRR